MDASCRFDFYGPACVAFARHAEAGHLTDVPDERVYAMLLMAKLFGYEDAERDRLERVFGERLTPSRRAKAEEDARAALGG